MNIVIYHKNCLDGFGAMWCARQALGEKGTRYIAGQYDNAKIPDCRGANVYLVDFSYKRDDVVKICNIAKSVTILDHHKTAYEDLHCIAGPTLTMVWDMEKSGAGITWDYFFPDQPRPDIIQFIEDRDLWRFKYPATKAVNIYLRSLNYDYKRWEVAMAMPINEIAKIGESLLDYQAMIISSVIKNVEYRDVFGHMRIPCIKNCPYMIVSEVLHELDQNVPFAGAYWNTQKGELWSLRSAEHGVDVGELAKNLGGGGHVHASGVEIAVKKAFWQKFTGLFNL